MRVRGPVVAVVVVGSVLAGGPAQAAGPISFKTGGAPSQLHAVTTSSGTYVASVARKGRAYVTRVNLVRGGAATLAAALPVKFDDGEMGILAREDGTVPCVYGSVKSSPYVACLEEGAWRERRFTGGARTRVMTGVVRAGTSLYAYLDTSDFGALERIEDPAKLRRFRFTTEVRRWDGASWVPAAPSVPGYTYSLTALSGPGRCIAAALPNSCDAPLLFNVAFKTRKITAKVQTVQNGRWSDVPALRLGKLDPDSVGEVAQIDGRLVITRQRGKLLELLSAGSAGTKAQRITKLAGRDFTADVGAVAGRAWIAWADIRYPKGTKPKPGVRGVATVFAAALDTTAGTLGAPQSLGTAEFPLASGRATRPFPLEVDGVPHVGFVDQRAGGDVALLHAAAP